MSRKVVTDAKRIVIKIGSSSLTGSAGSQLDPAAVAKIRQHFRAAGIVQVFCRAHARHRPQHVAIGRIVTRLDQLQERGADVDLAQLDIAAFWRCLGGGASAGHQSAAKIS